jgi:hypothetical protein
MITKKRNNLSGSSGHLSIRGGFVACNWRLLKEPGDFFWRIDEEAGTVFF